MEPPDDVKKFWTVWRGEASELINQVGGAPKEEFDACYAKIQMAIHLEAIAAFEAEITHGQDPDIKALAQQALPKIKHHLHALQSIFKEMERAHEDQTDNSGS